MLKIYFGLGRGLTPIKPGEKKPMLSDWRNRPIQSIDAAGDYPGHNWGWVLTATDLVVDVDPRNGGEEGLRRLNQEHGGGILRSFPAVKTPRGGVHLYTRLPPNSPVLRAKHDLYPGIDFLTVGRQCLIPGSRSEFGEYFIIDGGPPFDEPAPLAPGWLVATLAKPTTNARPDQGAPRMLETGLTVSQLAGLLDQLPVVEFREYNDWLAIMQASHDATDGRGMSAFVQWSIADPEYADAAPDIAKMWRALKAGEPGNVTAGTLIKAVTDRGGSVPTMSLAEGIANWPDTPMDLPQTLGSLLEMPSAAALPVVPISQLDAEIKGVKRGTPSGRLKNLALDIARHPELDRDRMLRDLSRRTGFTLGNLRDLAALSRQENAASTAENIIDPALVVARKALLENWGEGDHVVNCGANSFWEFDGMKWTQVDSDVIGQTILRVAEPFCASAGIKSTMQVVSQAHRAVTLKLARRDIKLDAGPPKKYAHILNLLNGELTFGRDGAPELGPHLPEHWQTTLLPVRFDPGAECPRFDAFLREIFAPLDDRDDMIEYLWELIGYSIQPVKDLAAWVLLTGAGANGKSTLLGVMTDLLGPHVEPVSMTSITGDNHGMARLPGKLLLVDDDLKDNMRLPDDFLKKISENKMMTANPKFEKPFQFENRAIIWMASNSMPRTADLSHGMVRRAHVLPFDRVFSSYEQDPTLGRHFARHELAGIFAGAVRGLQRLRKRGYFEKPKSADRLSAQWAMEANPVGVWADQCMIRENGEQIGMAEAYASYRVWAQDAGFDRKLTLIGFSKTLHAAKNYDGTPMFPSTKRRGGRRIIGYRLAPAETFDVAEYGGESQEESQEGIQEGDQEEEVPF